VDKTPQEWGDYVRAINPSFTGPRPRLQLNHGDQDEVISYNNFREAIDQWTNVLGLEATPTTTDTGFVGASATYDRQFWSDDCGYTVLEGWTALGKLHSMGYEAVHILEWFGLDQVREKDPWDEACGDSTGTAATTTGGTTTGGTTTGGTTTGGTTTSGGSTGMGGSTGTDAVTGTGTGTSSTTAPGTTSTGASVTSGGVTGTTATTATATTGAGTTGAAATTGGTLTATSTGGSAGDPGAQASDDSGCSCTAAGGRELPLSWMLTLAGLGLACGLRRRR
jgi:MYXO-CTERM domain-containing protein